MAMKCFRCHGIIPDVTYNGTDRYDCKNHIKIKTDINFEEYRKFRTD
jgi:hypothetical protein